MTVLDDLSRRRFLQGTSVAALSSLVPRFGFGQEQQRPLSANEFIAGKDRRLIVHNAKVGEIETPLVLLRESHVTPKELLFVRNNQVLPGTLSVERAEIKDWKIEFAGLIDRPSIVPVSELAKLAQLEYELVLQCSGNGRSRFSRFAKADGAQWEHGAMGNVKFKGVPLKAVLDHLRIRPSPEAKFVAAEGKDPPTMPDGADFEHSLPLDEALEKSLLAFSLNDEPIPKVHGGPVRIVTPGYYATMNVKWLSRLRFEKHESANHHHAVRYRTPLKPISPDSKFAANLENSEPNWKMRIKSVIFAPLEGEKLASGKVPVQGVAWNDGGAKITAVELSIDGGKSWRQTEIKAGGSVYSWYDWRLEVELPSGRQTILSRAIDAQGRTQPMDGSIFWNPAGYAWNGIDSVNCIVA